MAERAFNAYPHEVRAIQTGLQTQFRRVVKPQKFVFDDNWIGGGYWERKSPSIIDPVPERISLRDAALRCPFGQPGDRLWVREAWMPDPPNDGTWEYTAWAGVRTGRIAGVPERFRHPQFCNYAATWSCSEVIWTPGIHMPRWASRITLEVTGVRVERLQDISEADAMAEGIQQITGYDDEGPETCYHWDAPSNAAIDLYSSARSAYRARWESINGPGSWDANPWVWCVSFKRVEVSNGIQSDR